MRLVVDTSVLVGELAASCLAAVEANIIILDEGIYAALETEARERSLRHPRDWPVFASALALSAGIWTNDNGFFGTGVATWTTGHPAPLAPTPAPAIDRGRQEEFECDLDAEDM